MAYLNYNCNLSRPWEDVFKRSEHTLLILWLNQLLGECMKNTLKIKCNWLVAQYGRNRHVVVSISVIGVKLAIHVFKMKFLRELKQI